MYKLKTEGCMYQAILSEAGTVQYSSLDKRRVTDWIEINAPLPEGQIERRKNKEGMTWQQNKARK